MRRGAIMTMRPDTEMIINAFAKGAGFEIIKPEEFKKEWHKFDAIATNGYLRGSSDCIKIAEAKKIDYYYIDHAYVNPQRIASRLGDRSWMRITKNGMQNFRFQDRPSDRWDEYFSRTMKPKPWIQRGREIVVIGLSNWMYKLWGLHGWERDVLKKIYKQMKGKDMKIYIRRKPGGNIRGHASIDYSKIFGFVCYKNTVMSIEGLMNGVPVFCHPGNVAAEFSSGWDIANPWRGDRQPLLNHVAYSQFTISEMKSGYAWKILNDNTGN